ncbi:peptidyl-prolyl cis-trans isomerase [Cohnella soli]|uniref:Peptidyl-prolyl cis-trans isomerase n=1 Tax=Cohnella soli TaxID=425005 RepID=A0ABW0HUE8_9BACL
MAKTILGKGKSYAILGLLAALTVGFILIGPIHKTSDKNHSPYPISLNGSEVSEDEFGMYLDFNKALVVNDFKQTYDADYSEQFWTTPYSGEIPQRKLIDYAKAQLMKTRVVQLLAQKSGVIKEIGYRSFLEKMEAENARRSKAAANNEIVYGPTSFEVLAYYSYYMSNLENATIDAMLKNGTISISEEQAKRDYETNKQSKYAKQGRIKLEWATLAYGPGTSTKDKNDALDRMKQLNKAVANGASLVETASGLGVDVIDANLTDTSRRTAALENPLLLRRAERLKEGETSEVFEENEAFHIIRCVSASGMVILPFDQVKDSIARQLAKEKFDDIVQGEMEDSTIQWSNRIEMKLWKKWMEMNFIK